ncbi:MAG: AEC family transporter, partial [Pseudomonadota bacterium]
MATLLEVILPVFLVIGIGYVAVWKGLFSESGVDGLMVFTQQFAIPCLLFRAMSTLDLGANFSLKLMLVYYVPALSVFALGIVGARILFNRPWTDSVAIGFCCLFANMALLGLPISEKAFGPDSLSTNYALLSIHTPICYGLGITLMEIVRAESGSAVAVAGSVLKAMFRNALILGIAAGMAVNLSGVALPTFFIDGVDLMVSAALPAALFGLYWYKTPPKP